MLEVVKNDKKSDRQRIAYIMLAIRGKKFGFDKVLKTIIVTGGASMMQFQHFGGVAASLAAMVKPEAISGGDAKKLTALLQSNDDDDVNAPAATVFENSAGGGNVIDSLNGLLDKANAQLEDA